MGVFSGSEKTHLVWDGTLAGLTGQCRQPSGWGLPSVQAGVEIMISFPHSL